MALVLPGGQWGSNKRRIVDRLGGLVVIAPARAAGDPGSNPGPSENFSLKLLTAEDIVITMKGLQE